MKIKTVYQCTSCGYQSPKWAGKCPDCGEWNTLAEMAQVKGGAKAAKAAPKQPVSRLSEVETGSDQRLLTGIAEFDRVMGGGIVRDSVTIITSPPGGGKSTLSLMAASALAKQGFRVLYASGEESDSQIKNRADRILDTIAENIWIVADTSMDNVLDAIREIDPDLIILDSIQTFSLAEFLPSRAGNPTQTMECASALVAQAKNKSRPRAVLMIGQMNKSDEIAGLRALEHLVDAVLVLEGEGADWTVRVRCSKGTYVRTLCHDLGRALGCGGCMSSLRRTRAGSFTLAQAVTMQQVLDFAAGQDPQQLLMPVDAVFAAHPPLIVTLGQAAKLKNGAQVKDWQFQPGTYRVYAEDGEFLLLGRVEGGVLTTIKSFFEVNTLGT